MFLDATNPISFYSIHFAYLNVFHKEKTPVLPIRKEIFMYSGHLLTGIQMIIFLEKTVP